MTNPYFAYSLKQEYAAKSPVSAEPGKAKKARACDACSIRKTKCDNGRPCRQCINNNLECSELRQRKKPGPRSIRRKTINSINTLRNSPPESPDHVLVEVDFKNSSLPDLGAVVQELSCYAPEWFLSAVPYTTASMASEMQVLIPLVLDDPVIDASQSLRVYLKRYAVMALLLVLLELTKTAENASRIGLLINAVQRHVSCMNQICNDFIFFEQCANGFDVHYNLLLADLHMFSYMQLRSPQNTQNFVRLKSAITHFQTLDNSPVLNEVRLALYFWERHGAFFHSDSAYRNAVFGVAAPGLSSPSSFGLLEAYIDMLKTMEHEGVFKHGTPELFSYETRNAYSEEEFLQNASKLQLCLQANCQYIKEPADLAMCHLLGLSIRFKLLLKCSVQAAFLYKETLEIVDAINLVLTGLPNDNIRPWLAKLSSVTLLLEILEYFLRITEGTEMESTAVDSLIQFSGYVNLYLDKGSEVWAKRPLLSSWFQKLYLSEPLPA